MSFHPSKIQFFANRCKILNYYNLKSSPVYTIPKDSRSGWLSNDIYPPSKGVEEIKTKSNYKYTELYNTREQYIHSSKIKKEPAYIIGKAGMKEDEFYKKTKIKKRPKTAKNRNTDFAEENLNGDNCENKPNDNKNNCEKEKEEKYNQYYEIGTKFVNESRKPRAPLYSFAGGPFKSNYTNTRRVDNQYIPEHDFYEIGKYYVKESKKPRIPGYKFGKEIRLDPKIRTYKNEIEANNRGNNKKVAFEEEKVGNGDNSANYKNIIVPKNEEQKNPNYKNKNLNKDKQPQDFYEVREQYVKESKKPRVLAFTLYKTSGVKPKIIEGKKGEETFFYDLNKHYTYESQKPNAPKYSFGKPRENIPINNKKNKKNKKYKLRPQSAVFTNNFLKKATEVEQTNIKMNIKNGPGPGEYNIGGNFGENGLKISCSPLGRKYPKSNEFPGPGGYNPNYKVIKKREPIYSIGNEGKYDYYYDECRNYSNKMKRSYGSQYYRRNPSWIIAKNSKGDLIDRIIKENNRYK